MIAVFLLALAALVTYLVLAFRYDVAVWTLAPLLGYVGWAMFWLLTPEYRNRRRSRRSLVYRLGRVRITREYYVRRGERNVWQP